MCVNFFLPSDLQMIKPSNLPSNLQTFKPSFIKPSNLPSDLPSNLPSDTQTVSNRPSLFSSVAGVYGAPYGRFFRGRGRRGGPLPRSGAPHRQQRYGGPRAGEPSHFSESLYSESRSEYSYCILTWHIHEYIRSSTVVLILVFGTVFGIRNRT